ncbi:hypothetical protein BHE74_00037288 [Ensete ventricosum]|nr:hypothetical protein BHE74_00037288 [Ensete ventricosum]
MWLGLLAAWGGCRHSQELAALGLAAFGHAKSNFLALSQEDHLSSSLPSRSMEGLISCEDEGGRRTGGGGQRCNLSPYPSPPTGDFSPHAGRRNVSRMGREIKATYRGLAGSSQKLVEVIKGLLGVRWELTEGDRELAGDTLGVHQKMTETHREFAGGLAFRGMANPFVREAPRGQWYIVEIVLAGDIGPRSRQWCTHSSKVRGLQKLLGDGLS